MPELQILIPLFNDWESATRLLQELDRVAGARGERYGVLLVDDGSDRPCPFDAALAVALPNLVPLEVLTLTVNQGHVRAIAIGLAALAARDNGAPTVVMDGDGEDRPEDIPRLLERARQGGVEAGGQAGVIVAERRRRSEPLSFRLLYALYKLVFRALTGRRMTFGNFCLIPAGVLRRLVHRPELWNHLAGTLLAGRWRIERLPTDRGQRYAGQSKMNLPALVQHGLGAVAVDLDRVLIRLLIFLGAVTCLLGLALAVIVGVRILSDLAVPGWATTAFGLVSILFLQSIVFAFLLLFISLRTRGLKPVIPAEAWRDYTLTTQRLDSARDAG